jgi:hypothetical protein
MDLYTAYTFFWMGLPFLTYTTWYHGRWREDLLWAYTHYKTRGVIQDWFRLMWSGSAPLNSDPP